MTLVNPATVARHPRRGMARIIIILKVAALDVETIDPPAQAKIADVWREARSHVIAEAELVGTYSR